ncbi:MAG: flagellar biosynthetic protein FliO [Bdellovibrionaceae bacterium]|nr:flagellar biosynthetic protein FliO [Pseudobdellovibrionaceae bacterium]
MQISSRTLLIFFAALSIGASAHAKKRDVVADSIAKARAGEQVEISVDQGADLKDLLSGAKLVAKSDTTETEAAKAAAAFMSSGEKASSGSGDIAEEMGNESGATAAVAPVAAGSDESAVAAGEAAVQVASGATASNPANKPDVSKMNEKDIPVLESKPKAAKSGASMIARVLASLGVLLLLGLSVTIGLKKYTRRGNQKDTTTKIKILTQHHLGAKKSIAIIQVAGESILVGITDHSITMLKTLSLLDEEIPEETPRDFNSALGGFEFDGDDSVSRAPRGHDDFAMRGLSDIRDSVSKRLKGLKQI